MECWDGDATSTGLDTPQLLLHMGEWGSTRTTNRPQLLSKVMIWQQKDAVKASQERLQILDCLRHFSVALMEPSM